MGFATATPVMTTSQSSAPPPEEGKTGADFYIMTVWLTIDAELLLLPYRFELPAPVPLHYC